MAQELVGLVLDTDVVRLLERLEQARREIQERDEELTSRAERIMELSSKVRKSSNQKRDLDEIENDKSGEGSTILLRIPQY